MSTKNSKPAIAVAKQQRQHDEVTTLSTGVRAILRPVSASLIADVTTQIEDPPVPMWRNEEKNRDEPNPDDPSYIAAVRKAQEARGHASMEAVILFGVELVDEIPMDGQWLKNLRYLEKRGKLNLDEYDLSDEVDLEFLYKRYFAVSNEDIMRISKMSGLTEEAIRQAEANF